MTCTHIKIIRQKLKNFTQEFGDYDSPLYKKLGSIVDEKDIGAKLELRRKGGLFSSDVYDAKATYETYDFHYVSQKALEKICAEIDNLLEECKCYQGAVQDGESEKQKVKVKNRSLKGKMVVREDEIGNLRLEKRESETKLEDFKNFFENGKERLEKEKREVEDELKLSRELVSQLREEKARIENDNENLKKDLEKREKDESILKQERNDLTKKEGEIKTLRKKLLQTLEEKLDYFIEQLEIEESEKKKLCRAYESFHWAKENSSLNEIEFEEKKLDEIKRELRNKLKFQSVVQEFSSMCNEVAELKIELGQSRYESDQKQKLEAKIEALPKN